MKIDKHKKTYVIIAFILILSAIPAQVFTQDGLKEFNDSRLGMNNKGMKILAGWSLLNIATGLYGNFQYNGTKKYFFQMNAAWNVVNLSIASWALLNQPSVSPETVTYADILHEAHAFEKLLLFNAGLDVGYMGIGAFLREMGLRKDKNRLIGYGNSMILQGGFLFVFDVVLYALNQQHNQTLYKMIENISFYGNNLSITIPF